MRYDLLPASGLTSKDLERWRGLAEVALTPNPFLEPEFVLPAARAWNPSQLAIATVSNSDGWLAALPVVTPRSWRSVPGRCLAGWRHSYCYLGTPLVHRDRAETALATLIRESVRRTGCLALDWIDADGPMAGLLADTLSRETRTVSIERFERAALRREGVVGTGEVPLSSRHAREYRRKMRRLEDEVGPLSIRDGTDDQAAYDQFLALEATGWKGQVGTAMARRAGHSEFFRDVCRGFAAMGRLRMEALASERQTVAMRNELRAGDVNFTFKIAFDEQFGRYSPGVQLEIANLERFGQEKTRLADSCTAADNATLNRLWPDRRALQSIVAVDRRPRSIGTYGKWRAAAAALPWRRKLSRPTPGLRGH